jgi:hypothetical protein
MKYPARVFKTKSDDGLTAKTTVFLTEEGNVHVHRRQFTNKITGHELILRKWKGLFYVETMMAFKRKSFGTIMAAISDLIEENELYKNILNHSVR